MEFRERLEQLVEQIRVHVPDVHGEEATKQALVQPFLQMLDFDVFNPREVQPEYAAELGHRQGGPSEKVDYAISKNKELAMFIEVKAADKNITEHGGQIERYFNAKPEVRVAIITNGTRVRVFSDLQQPNMMDKTPWLDVDLLSPMKPAEIDALHALCKGNFEAGKVIALAEEMVFYNAMIIILSAQLREPSVSFVRWMAGELPAMASDRAGRQKVTQRLVELFRPLLQKALQATILDHVAKALANLPKPAPAELPVEDGDETDAPQRDDDAAGETGQVDRATWALKAAPATLNLVDKLVEIINEKAESRRSLTFNRYFIGLHDRTGPRNFVTFQPRKEKLRMIVQVPDVAAWVGRWKGTDIDAAVNAGGVRVNILPEQFEKNRALLTEMLHQAVVEVQS